MHLIPAVIGVITLLAIVLFAVIRRQAWVRGLKDAELTLPGIYLRKLGVEPPPDMLRCLQAIDAVLTEEYPDWRKHMELVIEWSPYGVPIIGPYVKTGFVTRGPTTQAVLPPVAPFVAQLEDKIARVVGTIAVQRRWPWSSFARVTIKIMDGRQGATKRQVLLGDGLTTLPQASASSTALFYEVCWRAVPVGLLDFDLQAVPTGTPAPKFAAMVRKMQEAARAR